MSDDWAITPPCSPVFCRKSDDQNDVRVLEGKSHVLYIRKYIYPLP